MKRESKKTFVGCESDLIVILAVGLSQGPSDVTEM